MDNGLPAHIYYIFEVSEMGNKGFTGVAVQYTSLYSLHNHYCHSEKYSCNNDFNIDHNVNSHW